jgi:lipoprotein-releasing system permease protein
MIVVATGTMALIIVLSVFNGLEGLLRSIYGTVDPNLVISASIGKSFEFPDSLKSKIERLEGIELITEVIEDNALLKYNNSQRVARVKGVSDNFVDQGRLDNNIVYGDLVLKEEDRNYMILGRGVQYDLNVNPANDFYSIQVFYPEDIGPGVTNPEKLFRSANILPGAIFAIENYFDNNYVFVPLSFTEALFKYQGKRTSLEIKVKYVGQIDKVKNSLENLLGADFLVKSSDELHSDLYKILKIEKFFVFLIFSIIIAIASINIFFSLTMLAIDKQKDIAILMAQGATKKLIRNIFLIEGAIVAFTGAFTGLILGLIISFGQQYFGLISTGTQTTIMQAYPIKVLWTDVFFTVVCIIAITIAATIQPAISASKRVDLKQIQ